MKRVWTKLGLADVTWDKVTAVVISFIALCVSLFSIYLQYTPRNRLYMYSPNLGGGPSLTIKDGQLEVSSENEIFFINSRTDPVAVTDIVLQIPSDDQTLSPVPIDQDQFSKCPKFGGFPLIDETFKPVVIKSKDVSSMNLHFIHTGINISSNWEQGKSNVAMCFKITALSNSGIRQASIPYLVTDGSGGMGARRGRASNGLWPIIEDGF